VIFTARDDGESLHAEGVFIIGSVLESFDVSHPAFRQARLTMSR
jgi:hypothetical protein